jgi:aryl-alcohol dehydrogenase-like predicted oxidoreductase
MCNKPEITSPIVGVSRVEQLMQLMESASIRLEDEDAAYIEELYEPLQNLLSIGMS